MVWRKSKERCSDDFRCSQWRIRGKKKSTKADVKQGSAGFCVKSQIINSGALWALPSQSQLLSSALQQESSLSHPGRHEHGCVLKNSAEKQAAGQFGLWLKCTDPRSRVPSWHFSKLSEPQKSIPGPVKTAIAEPTTRASDAVQLRRSPGICIFINFPAVAYDSRGCSTF